MYLIKLRVIGAYMIWSVILFSTMVEMAAILIEAKDFLVVNEYILSSRNFYQIKFFLLTNWMVINVHICVYGVILSMYAHEKFP